MASFLLEAEDYFKTYWYTLWNQIILSGWSESFNSGFKISVAFTYNEKD